MRKAVLFSIGVLGQLQHNSYYDTGIKQSNIQSNDFVSTLQFGDVRERAKKAKEAAASAQEFIDGIEKELEYLKNRDSLDYNQQLRASSLLSDEVTVPMTAPINNSTITGSVSHELATDSRIYNDLYNNAYSHNSYSSIPNSVVPPNQNTQQSHLSSSIQDSNIETTMKYNSSSGNQSSTNPHNTMSIATSENSSTSYNTSMKMYNEQTTTPQLLHSSTTSFPHAYSIHEQSSQVSENYTFEQNRSNNTTNYEPKYVESTPNFSSNLDIKSTTNNQNSVQLHSSSQNISDTSTNDERQTYNYETSNDSSIGMNSTNSNIATDLASTSHKIDNNTSSNNDEAYYTSMDTTTQLQENHSFIDPINTNFVDIQSTIDNNSTLHDEISQTSNNEDGNTPKYNDKSTNSNGENSSKNSELESQAENTSSTEEQSSINSYSKYEQTVSSINNDEEANKLSTKQINSSNMVTTDTTLNYYDRSHTTDIHSYNSSYSTDTSNNETTLSDFKYGNNRSSIYGDKFEQDQSFQDEMKDEKKDKMQLQQSSTISSSIAKNNSINTMYDTNSEVLSSNSDLSMPMYIETTMNKNSLQELSHDSISDSSIYSNMPTNSQKDHPDSNRSQANSNILNNNSILTTNRMQSDFTHSSIDEQLKDIKQSLIGTNQDIANNINLANDRFDVMPNNNTQTNTYQRNPDSNLMTSNQNLYENNINDSLNSINRASANTNVINSQQLDEILNNNTNRTVGNNSNTTNTDYGSILNKFNDFIKNLMNQTQ